MTAPTKFDFETRLFINNEFVDAKSGELLTVNNPANEEVVTEKLHIAGPEDVTAAVAGAKLTFTEGPWRSFSGAQRAALLNKFANLLEENAQELAYLDAICMGMPAAINAAFVIPETAAIFRYYAGWADKIAGESFEPDDGFFKIVRHEPIGVVAGIAPWNAPVLYAGYKIAPALAAGNTLVFKASEKSPLSALAMARLAKEAGFPSGVLQVVSGAGKTGALLASDMTIAKLSFTGSTGVGKIVQELGLNSNMKQVTAELGGKSPAIVFDDADIANAIEGTANGFLLNSGQICVAMSRLFVQDTIAEKFIAQLKSRFEQLSTMLGDPFSATAMYGPVADVQHFNRVMSYIDIGNKASTPLTGGAKKDGKGYYIEPTVYLDPSKDSPLYREEIFGPVLVVKTFKTAKEAIALANDTETGLAASLYTSDLTRALSVASQLEAGSISINSSFFPNKQAPFGGFKRSGSGKELGREGLIEYMKTQSILIKMNMLTRV